MAERHIGEQVRYYSVALGWMFGTVESVRDVRGLEMVTVRFKPCTGRYRPHPEQVLEMASLFLEQCS